jgi:hypothetical protein
MPPTLPTTAPATTGVLPEPPPDELEEAAFGFPRLLSLPLNPPEIGGADVAKGDSEDNAGEDDSGTVAKVDGKSSEDPLGRSATSGKLGEAGESVAGVGWPKDGSPEAKLAAKGSG